MGEREEEKKRRTDSGIEAEIKTVSERQTEKLRQTHRHGTERDRQTDRQTDKQTH